MTFTLSSYIGLPFVDHGRDKAGIDCWGLYRLMFLDAFGILLPSYNGEYVHTEDRAHNAKLFSHRAIEWLPVKAGEERMGDAVLLYIYKFPCHIGFVAGDGYMVHAQHGTDSEYVSYNYDPHWKDRRKSFYRHPSLNDRDPAD